MSRPTEEDDVVGEYEAGAPLRPAFERRTRYSADVALPNGHGHGGVGEVTPTQPEIPIWEREERERQTFLFQVAPVAWP
jgi:hypothetical protein